MTFSAMVWAAVILISLLVVLRRRKAVVDGIGGKNGNVCSTGLLSCDRTEDYEAPNHAQCRVLGTPTDISSCCWK